MNHMYITPTFDEKVVIKDALDKSNKFGPYIVHYHPSDEKCEGRHRFFVDGEERES
jgi:hypothetical protein